MCLRRAAMRLFATNKGVIGGNISFKSLHNIQSETEDLNSDNNSKSLIKEDVVQLADRGGLLNSTSRSYILVGGILISESLSDPVQVEIYGLDKIDVIIVIEKDGKKFFALNNNFSHISNYDGTSGT